MILRANAPAKTATIRQIVSSRLQTWTNVPPPIPARNDTSVFGCRQCGVLASVLCSNTDGPLMIACEVSAVGPEMGGAASAEVRDVWGRDPERIERVLASAAGLRRRRPIARVKTGTARHLIRMLQRSRSVHGLIFS
jgi:hypothetical protein